MNLIRSTIALIATATLAVTVTPDAHATGHVIVGSTDTQRLQGHVTPTPANHTYQRLTDGLDVDVSARYLNLEADAPGQWADIADGDYDTAIRRVAQAIANTGRLRLVAFNHEPSTEVGTAGTARDYRQAFRRFHDIATPIAPNLRTVWAVTQVSVANGTTTPYYPGKRTVDYISSNAFNRYRCAAKTGPWTTFGSKVQPLITLARELDKPIVISEWGMTNDVRRPAWIDAATHYIAAHPRIEAVFYYNSPWNTNCKWELTTPGDYAALSRMMETLR